MPKAYDLTNQRFGRLIALHKCDYKKGNKYPWHCICDCGNFTDVPTQDLTTGKVQSCGCLRKEKASKLGKKTGPVNGHKRALDITGDRFGKLIAIAPLESRNNQIFWQCKCDCGNTTIVKLGDLRSGNTKSCGCLRSKGQELIASLLTAAQIPFETEKMLDCIYPNSKGQARFDFYVNNEYLIEFDGIQHFKQVDFFALPLTEQIERDQFKNLWCKEHMIPLIRIPYTHLNELCINDLLLSTSNFIID